MASYILESVSIARINIVRGSQFLKIAKVQEHWALSWLQHITSIYRSITCSAGGCGPLFIHKQNEYWSLFIQKQIEILGGGCAIRERHISNSVPKAGYEPRTTSLCYHIWMCTNITPCSLVPNPSNKTWYPDMRAVQLAKATHTAEPPSHSRYQPKWAKTQPIKLLLREHTVSLHK